MQRQNLGNLIFEFMDNKQWILTGVQDFLSY